MSSFKSTQVLRSRKVGEVENPEARYWNRFKSPMVRYEQSSVTHIDYIARKGQFCATSGFRIVICDYASGASVKQLTRFSSRVYGATFGRDGELLSCGTDDGVVLALSASSGTQLRSFRGHSARVRTVGWTNDGLSIVSGSDDRTVRLWDLSGATQISAFDCFSDSVRCVSITRENDLVLAGSYDHRVRLLDPRIKEGNALVAEIDCGAPVESICAFESPAPFAFVAASGNTVRSFDLRTRQPLASACAHHKTVTSLAFAPACAVPMVFDDAVLDAEVEVSSNSSMRLFSASLDGHVRIYDVSTLAPTFKFAYASPVLSLRVANDDGLIVGMQNGLITLQKRAQRDAEADIDSKITASSNKSKKSRGGNAEDDSDDGDTAESRKLQRKQRAKLDDNLAERVDRALFRAIAKEASSAQLDAIFQELTGTKKSSETANSEKKARLQDAEAAQHALVANQDRLDEVVLRGKGPNGVRRSRWDTLLARFEQRKCFELVFGRQFAWLNKHRPELIFCIIRELLRRNVLDNCLSFRSNSSQKLPESPSRRLIPSKGSKIPGQVAKKDEAYFRNVLTFISSHANEVRYERVLLALCRRVVDIPNLTTLLVHGGSRTRGLFRQMRNIMASQLEFVKQAHVVCGMIDTLLSTSAAAPTPNSTAQLT